MNQTMKWSLAATVAILIGIIVAAIITSRPTDNDSNLTNTSQALEQDGSTDTEAESSLQTLDGFEPFSTPVSELEVIDQKVGTGATASKGTTITANYTGAYVVNGQVFDSSAGRGPFTAPLISPDESEDGSGLITGWVRGIEGMKEGGERRLIIPGNLAYGEAPDGYNPGDGSRPLGALVFDIELISVEE